MTDDEQAQLDLRQKLKTALLTSFPTRGALREFARSRLGVTLDHVSTEPSLDVCVGDLIAWHASRAPISDLVESLAIENEGLQEVKQLLAAVNRSDSSLEGFERLERRRLEELAKSLGRLNLKLAQIDRQRSPEMASEIESNIGKVKRELERGGQPLPERIAIGSIDRFVLRKFIAEGDTSWVYLARDMNRESDVVVKVVRGLPERAGDRRARLLRSARIHQQIRWNSSGVVGIADIHDVEDPQDGYAYLWMGHYQERDISHWLARAERRVTVQEAVDVLRGVVRGVSSLHQAGWCHNDIRPSNVLIDARGCGYLSGFDWSHKLDEAMDVSRGRVVSDFAAPEVLLNGTGGVLADVYSLGMLALFVIERCPPPANVAWKQSPSLAYLIGQPPELVRVIERSIAFDPGDRYSSIAEFGAAFDAVAPTIRDLGVPTEDDVLELLGTLEGRWDVLPELWEGLDAGRIARHPGSPWRWVALSLSHEAASQEQLSALRTKIIRIRPDAEIAARERRVRLAVEGGVDSAIGYSPWSLLNGLCALAPEYLRELLRRSGTEGEVDGSGSILEVAAAVFSYCRTDPTVLVDTLYHCGGQLSPNFPTDVSVSSAHACLMFAVLRHLGMLHEGVVGSGLEARLLEWRPHLDRFRINAEVSLAWEQWRERLAETRGDGFGLEMANFDAAFAVARRLSLWTPPRNLRGPPARVRHAVALSCAPQVVVDSVIRELAIPAWLRPMFPGGRLEWAENICLFADTWMGALDRIPGALARGYSELLREVRGTETLQQALLSDGLTEPLRAQLRLDDALPLGVSAFQVVRSISRSLESLLSGAVRPWWFSGLERMQDGSEPDRKEVIDFRRRIVGALEPLEFDRLLELVDCDQGRMPGVEAPLSTRAAELCESAISERVWVAFCRQTEGFMESVRSR